MKAKILNLRFQISNLECCAALGKLMKLQFDANQDFQLDAINAAVDLFKDQLAGASARFFSRFFRGVNLGQAGPFCLRWLASTFLVIQKST